MPAKTYNHVSFQIANSDYDMFELHSGALKERLGRYAQAKCHNRGEIFTRTPYINFMKRFVHIALIPILLATPAQADPKDWEELRKGLEELSEGTQQFFENWVDELGPLLNSLRNKIDDLGEYEPPEVLPNGDIIIRRKPKPKKPVEQKPSYEI